MLNCSRDKKEGTYRSGEREEKGSLCDPGSKLYSWEGGREGGREWCEENK